MPENLSKRRVGFYIDVEGISSDVGSVETERPGDSTDAEESHVDVEHSFDDGDVASSGVRHLNRSNFQFGCRKAGTFSLSPQSLRERFDIVKHSLGRIFVRYTPELLRRIGKRLFSAPARQLLGNGAASLGFSGPFGNRFLSRFT